MSRLSTRASTRMRWTADEVAALETEARFARNGGRALQASRLEEVAIKIRASLARADAFRLDTDAAALAEAEGLATRPGPTIRIADGVVEVLRSAILACQPVHLAYVRSRTRETLQRVLHPYGFLYGPRPYLVGFEPAFEDVRLLALSGVREAALLDGCFERPEDFDLRRFAERSFGVFQEPTHEIVWRLDASVAASAREYVFHPAQELHDQPGGSLMVRFRAGGLQEMAFHAFTWQGHLEVLEPKELREMLREMAETVAAVHGS